jgi:hypothetical protein
MDITARRQQLADELERLGRERGRAAESAARLVMAEVVRWLRSEGHGEVRLSAVDHVLSLKFRVDTVIKARGGPA